jgi:hypothetical protein
MGFAIKRLHVSTTMINEQNTYARLLIAAAREALAAPIPDTFLGHKTQEPFPAEVTPAGTISARSRLETFPGFSRISACRSETRAAHETESSFGIIHSDVRPLYPRGRAAGG